ncbi:MAG: hypothetical protein QM765_30620 [Myxococcales bacterium]
MRAGCHAPPASSEIGGTWGALANASGKGVDQSAFTYPDGCADIEDLHQRGFRINFDGGPLSSLGISGANVTDLDLNTVGEYPCGMHSGPRAVGSPSDPENPAYSNGGYDTLNQNTAVEGDCLHGSSPATWAGARPTRPSTATT